MTTSQITWHKPADLLPDADTSVLLGLDVDGIKTSCEGFLDGDTWRDTDAMPLDARHVRCWAQLPECPL